MFILTSYSLFFFSFGSKYPMIVTIGDHMRQSSVYDRLVKAGAARESSLPLLKSRTCRAFAAFLQQWRHLHINKTFSSMTLNNRLSINQRTDVRSFRKHLQVI